VNAKISISYISRYDIGPAPQVCRTAIILSCISGGPRSASSLVIANSSAGLVNELYAIVSDVGGILSLSINPYLDTLDIDSGRKLRYCDRELSTERVASVALGNIADGACGIVGCNVARVGPISPSAIVYIATSGSK